MTMGINMKSGYYQTNLSGEMEYQSFVPTPLQDLNFTEFPYETMTLLSQANYALGQLNELANHLADVGMFLASFVRKEALYSSQIEGTQATLEDIFDINNDANVNVDIDEVVNHVHAINYGVELLEELPLCTRYFKKIHYVLLQGVRGEGKNRGEFRKTQNWVGPAGASLKTATYIPPNVPDMEKGMSDLEKYINEEKHLDPLIVAALIHYQFVTIHPFLDGNGRLGRILIILYLISVQKLKYPCLNLSYYLKRNQGEYYARLNYIRFSDDYFGWINFFLRGVLISAEEAIAAIKKIMVLREKNFKKIPPRQQWLLTFLEKNPIINARKTSELTGINYHAVNRTINKYVELHILLTSDESKKNRTYIYQEYIDILKE